MPQRRESIWPPCDDPMSKSYSCVPNRPRLARWIVRLLAGSAGEPLVESIFERLAGQGVSLQNLSDSVHAGRICSPRLAQDPR